MVKTKKEKYAYLEQLLQSAPLFEREILQVTSFKDKEVMMKILAKRLVRERVKHKLNFLYIKSLADLDLKVIKPALFEEMVDEYMSFGVDELFLDKNEIQKGVNKAREFIYKIAEKYAKKYSILIYAEIVDTFIELAQTAIYSKQSLTLIQEVFETILSVHKSMIAIQDAPHLLTKVHSAYNFKNLELSKLQIKSSELQLRLEDESIDDEKRDNLLLSYYSLKKKLENMEKKTLDAYDAALQRLKHSMVQQLAKEN